MKKRLLFFMVLLLGICAAVPASAEEKKNYSYGCL